MPFADDTNIFIQAKNITDIILRAETLLKTLSRWLKDNRMSLNVEQTEYSIFHNNRTQTPDNCNHLTFDNITIKRVLPNTVPRNCNGRQTDMGISYKVLN